MHEGVIPQQRVLSTSAERSAEALKGLLAKFGTPLDYSIPEWCVKRGIHPATYYRMRKSGNTPDILVVGGQRRITLQADLEWEQRNTKKAVAA